MTEVRQHIDARWPNLTWETWTTSLNMFEAGPRWPELALRQREDVAALQAKDLNTIDAARAERAITAFEAEWLTRRRREQVVTEGMLERYAGAHDWDSFRLDAQSAETTTRADSSSTRSQFNKVVVMDMQRVLNAPRPVTLLWAGSATIRRTGRSFHAITCMTGVTCFPAPSVSATYASEDVAEPRFDRRLRDAINDLPVRSPAESSQAVRWTPAEADRRHESVPPPPLTPDDALQPLQLPAMPIKVESYDSRLRMSALPDGTLVLHGSLETVEIRWVEGAPSVVPSPAKQAERIFPTRKGYWAVSDDSLSFVDVQGKVRSREFPRRDSWAQFQATTWYRVGAEELAQIKPEGITIARPDTSTRLLVPATSRRAAFRTVLDASDLNGQGLNFGDALLWLRTLDASVSGLNLRTGQFEQGQGSRRAWIAPQLGSVAAKWDMECLSSHCVVMPFDGSPTWGFKAHYVETMARSANGKLAAVAQSITDTVQTLWDMRNRRPIARISPPPGAWVKSVAFSWRGDKLWVLSEQPRKGLYLQAWDIPLDLRDPATDNTYPDQVDLRR